MPPPHGDSNSPAAPDCPVLCPSCPLMHRRDRMHAANSSSPRVGFHKGDTMAFRLAACLLFVVSLRAAGNTPSDWTAVRGVAVSDAVVTHEGRPAIRLESPSGSEAILRSAPVKLVLGRRYEIHGWLRAEGLEVTDSDRTPIATGVSLAMASMPWDVHSESLGGTTEWKRVSLSFIATQA